MKKLNLTLVLALSLILMGTTVFAQQKVSVAAASDLKFALDSIITLYKQQNPKEDIQVTYGSSGKFFEQIQHDAPFDVYFSADYKYPQLLKDKGLAISEVKIYGIGRIVIWSKKLDPNKLKMKSLLDSKVKKVAIANPDHAPYGARAKESLEFYKIYDKVKPNLVFGENISQTAQFVTMGAADIGIVALSLALSPSMQKENGKFYLIPENAHQPLEQGYVVLKHAKENESAVKFYNFITTPAAVAILTHFGFKQKEK